MAPRAGHGPPRTRRARLGALRRDADPDRGFQRQRTHPGLLRHAAQRSAPGAHRLPGRLVRRGRHPHGRPARTAPVGLLGRRRGIRPDGLAADGVPAHGQNPVERLDDLQHHAAQSRTRAPAREFLRLGLGEPACGRGFDPLGEHRLPQTPRFVHHGARLLPLAPRQPRRGDAQRRPAPRIRHRGRQRRAADRRFGPPCPLARLQGALRRGGLRRLRSGFRKPGRRGRQLLRAQQQRAGDVLDQPVGQRSDQRHAGLRSGGAPVRAEHHAAGREELHQLRRTDREDDRLCPPVLPGGGGARAGRQRPFGEDRRRIRTDGRHPPHARLPAPCGAEHGRGLLAHVRRHARPGRHGTVRQERLGGQGLHPHQLRRRAPRGMGAVRRHQRRSLGSLHRTADRQPAPHGGAGRPRLGAQGRRRPQHPPVLRTP